MTRRTVARGPFTMRQDIGKGDGPNNRTVARGNFTVSGAVDHLDTYTDRDSWLANPAILGRTSSFEDFSNTLVGPDGVLAKESPLNSLTDNEMFAPGGIAAGIEFFVNGLTDDVNKVVILTPEFFGVQVVCLGANTYREDLLIDLSPAVKAFGFNMIGTVDTGYDNLFKIYAYDEWGRYLGVGMAYTRLAPYDNSFLGFIAHAGRAIGHLKFVGSFVDNGGELISNVEWIVI